MDNFEMLHGFSGVFALLGSVPNSDSGLAKLHETKDALGVGLLFSLSNVDDIQLNPRQFFQARCRADKDEVLTHLKAHV